MEKEGRNDESPSIVSTNGTITAKTVTADPVLLPVQVEETVPPSMSKIESFLLQSLTDCHVRSEVENCMNSILVDVEMTYSLSQQLELHTSKQHVHRQVREQKATILEANAERKARKEEKILLADALVQDLMKTNLELEKLLQWKQEHAAKVEEYDELVAKLAQTEEELQEANRISYGGGPKPRQVARAGSKDSVDQGEPDIPEQPIDAEATKGELAASPMVDAEKEEDSKPAASPHSNQENIEAKLPAGEQGKVGADDADVVAPSESLDPVASVTVATVVNIPDERDAKKQETPPTVEVPEEVVASVVVVLEEDEPEEKIPGLVEMDMEILIAIFGFLDAMDILNTAQINLTMYNRVDDIFGISEDGQSPPVPPPAPAPAKKPPPVASAQPPPQPTPNNVVAPTASQKPAASDAGGPLGKGLFSMLQPQPRPTGSSSTGKRPEPGKSQPLNAAVAQSMASKLSDAELTAIISMTNKLSKMEKEVNLLRNEKEALAAKLDGTEAVKQFLISKVRDVEVKLVQSREDEIKVTQQIASDQEVIAFLDSRVQILEKDSDTVVKERDSALTGLQTLKVSSSKKITMLNDMLKYEREKLKEEESDWKATKKVLVKEVKSCRAQILALQAERDGFKEQNEMLKRAIVSTGKMAPSPSR